MKDKLLERKRSGKRYAPKAKNDIPITKEKYVEIDYTLDGSVKQLFLNLTKMQIPFDYEKTLEPFFPEGMQKDEHGNYFIKIGDSKTMFCGHLDTYCKEYKRVWHIIKDNVIKTDGTTTLGGDDKAGIVVMIKMIEAGVPGLYYFFRGEEGVTSPSGTWGSKQALRTRLDFFKNYDKCIAFDRRGLSSIISEQMYNECCSPEFVSALEKEFKNNGLDYKDDPTGMWCDSGVFMELIPECTNISVGYKSEHTFNEEQNIEHLEKLVEACIKINWENLPVKRDPEETIKSIGRYKYSSSNWGYYGNQSFQKPKAKKLKSDYVTMDDLFFNVTELLNNIGYECLNEDEFDETEEMYFSNAETGDFFGIRIVDYDIYMSDDNTLRTYTNLGDLTNFTKYVSIGTGFSTVNDYDDNIRSYPNYHEDEDDDYYTVSKQGDKFSSFSKIQIKTFEDFVKKHPELTKKVIELAEISKDDFVDLSNTLWLEIDDAMNKEGYQMDYREHGTNITPDDFAAWIKENLKTVRNIQGTKKNVNNSKKDETPNIKEGGFFKYIKDNKLMINDYSTNEHKIFSDLVDREKGTFLLLLLDIDINQKKLRKNTLDAVNDILDSINKKHYVDIFLSWAFDYKDDIEKYYKSTNK